MSDSSDDMEMYSGFLDCDDDDLDTRIENIEIAILGLAKMLQETQDIPRPLIKILKRIEKVYL